ncbi:MAG: hypothetical protein JXB23_09055 [Candidatus Aminicenantes bacterium]|nr:hypothetical protein [Candidatus Aminicenantes bacterium]
MKSAKLIGMCLILIIVSSCMPSKLLLTPIPPKIETMEGYASLRIKGEEGATRSKFSFLFSLPSRGKIEVSDFLGRSLNQIMINEEGAYFIVPSKKVFWQGSEEEIVYRFLGFRLNLKEMISLLNNEWEWGDEEEASRLVEWVFERDKQGRIVIGRRGELWFYVQEFIVNTSLARTITFRHPLHEGSIRILNIAFNRPVNQETFATTLLRHYQQKTWDEIEELLRR